MFAERTAGWETGNLVCWILDLRRDGGGVRSEIWWGWWQQLGTSAPPASACTEAVRALQTFRQIYTMHKLSIHLAKQGTAIACIQLRKKDQSLTVSSEDMTEMSGMVY